MVLLLLSLLCTIQDRIPPPLRRDSSSRIAQWNGTTLLRVFLWLLNACNLLFTPQNAPLVTDFAQPAITRLASDHFPVRICHRGRFCNTELVPALWRSIHERFNHQFSINFRTNRLPSPRLSFLLNIVAWMSEVFRWLSIQNASIPITKHHHKCCPSYLITIDQILCIISGWLICHSKSSWVQVYKNIH